jgi:hypothetical protein
MALASAAESTLSNTSDIAVNHNLLLAGSQQFLFRSSAVESGAPEA